MPGTLDQQGGPAGSLSDFKRAQQAAERAATKGQAQGARLLLARARLLESSALYEQGRLTQAAAASQEARDIYTVAGDRAGAAAALNNIATVLSDRGDVIKATDEAGNVGTAVCPLPPRQADHDDDEKGRSTTGANRRVESDR